MLECRNVTKEFYYFDYNKFSLRLRFIQAVKGESRRKQPLFSLGNFELVVHKGDSVAIVGSNGSGKSTALRLMAGIYKPSTGTIKVSGRVAAVIELGAGFNSELTGAENVELYGAIMGLSRKELAAQFNEILDFAGVGEFINIPVKYYSSGMYARLAFSVAICVKPDLLLIDEVLSVGDSEFRERCLERLRSFSLNGGTLITASHDLSTIRQLCTHAVWLDKGRLRMKGKVIEVLKAYEESYEH